MKNLNFRQAAQKTKTKRRAALKGSTPARPFPQTSLMCRRTARLNVEPTSLPCMQPASPPFCAAHQPAKNSCFSFRNTALQPTWPSI